MSMSVTVYLADFDTMIDGMESEVQAALRPAAQAGAQVLYDAVLTNVRSMHKVTGNLERSIYQVFSARNSGPMVAAYRVSWNGNKAPHGHLVEYGHLQRYEITYDPKTRRFTTHKDRPLPVPKHVAAHPFIRPAASRLPAAVDAAKAELYQRLTFLS
jgi:hypothetical protein